MQAVSSCLILNQSKTPESLLTRNKGLTRYSLYSHNFALEAPVKKGFRSLGAHSALECTHALIIFQV